MAVNVRVEMKQFFGGRQDRERATANLVQQFKRAVNKAGVLQALKEHEFYEKKSEKRRRKKRQSYLQRFYASEEFQGRDNNFEE